MHGMLCPGPDSSQKRDDFAVAYLGNTWTFTKDTDQEHVDAVESPAPKSVGFIV